MRESVACGLRIALATIAIVGIALSICSIVSYLPPSAGYCGGISSLLSLITLAICSVRSVSARDQRADATEQLSISDREPAQPTSPLPCDVLIHHIFNHLDGCDLTRASQVCKPWNLAASDNQLWERICLQETIAPLEEQILDAYNYQAIYHDAKELNCRIRKVTPKELKISTSTSKIDRGLGSRAMAFLRTNDRMFLYFMNSRFEMWDSSLSKCLFSMPTWSLSCVEIKCVGNSVYLAGRSNSGFFTYCVYPFEFENGHLSSKPKWSFEGAEKWRSHETEFELGGHQVLIGQKDGVIDIVDLTSEGLMRMRIRVESDGETIDYTEQSNWNREDERCWEASFAKKEQKYVADFLKELLLWMKEGKCEREMIETRRNNHLVIQQCERLVGHTDAITDLRITGKYLLSSSQDGTIKQWNLSTCECIQTIVTKFERGAILLQATDRSVFGIGSEEEKTIICQWDLLTGECLHQINLGEPGFTTYHVTGNLLFRFYWPRLIKTMEIYDLSTQERIKTLTCQLDFWSSPFDFTNNCLYLLDNENQLFIWDFSPSQ